MASARKAGRRSGLGFEVAAALVALAAGLLGCTEEDGGGGSATTVAGDVTGELSATVVSAIQGQAAMAVT